jgi:hypothetical protein
MSVRKGDGSLVYQFEVTLKEIKPPIWRRFQAPGSLTLAQLHDALQIIMGWTDSHLHRFIINGQEFGRPDYEERFDENEPPLRDERCVRLADLFAVVPAAFLYEYDYGDSWLHVIVVEWTMPARSDVPYPSCLEGERACPPEDVGGVSGYEELLAVLADPEHEEHESMRMWAGEDFGSPLGAEVFDVEAVNSALRHL